MSGDSQNNGLDFELGPPVPAAASAGTAPIPAGTAPGGYGVPGSHGAAPIADLTYRTYDGPLYTRRARWWIVALNSLRLSKQKKGFWIAAAVSLLPYVAVIMQLIVTSNLPGGAANNPFANTTTGQKYAFNFFQAYSSQVFFLFIIALMVGSGSIALDNRSNALLVYLSKPITKSDYLIGKWAGVFLALFGVAFVPAVVLYIYCLLSFYNDGFLRHEPWLWLRIIGACAVPAAVHASLMMGFSAWSKTPRMAGAIYAGVYFIGAIIAGATWAIVYMGNFGEGVLMRHMSIDGIIKGLGQNVLGVDVRMPTWNNVKQMPEVLTIEPPSMKGLLLLAVTLCVIGIAAARMRIRAVEVVKG